MLQRLGKYEIVTKIGQGAMGEVFKAHDPILNRDVAIKTMTAAIGADEDLRKRFLREAQSAARLNHPNIITVFDFGEEQGKIYMAMELLEGQDLKDMIGRHTPLTLEQKLGLMEQICDGLAFAHTKEVIHRDLKPANIHVQPGGQVKIMDFGLAKLSSSDMTRAGVIMGTPNYMSPEQVRGEKADTRSDVFSLGAVFYELLANRKPFDAETLHAILFQVMQNEPEPIWQLVPDVPPLLAQAIDRAMAKDATQRYRDAGEFREALRGVRAGLSLGGTLLPVEEPGLDKTILTPIPRGIDAPSAPRPIGVPSQAVPPQRLHPPTPLPGAPMTPIPGRGPATPIPGGPGTPIPRAAPPTPLPSTPLPVIHPPTPIPRQAPPTPLPTTPLPVFHPPTPIPWQAPPTPLPTTVLPPVARPPAPTPVEGAMALDAQRRPAESPRMPPTLSGQASTQVSAEPATQISPPVARPSPARPARRAPSWQVPVIVAAAVAVVGGTVVVYRMTRPEPTTEVSPSPAPPDDHLKKELLTGQLQLARKSLEDKEYKGAVTQAEQVLQKDPGNAEAKQIIERAQGVQREVEDAVKRARAALDAGDHQGASQALSKILSLDPKSPAIAEFSSRLNSVFRGQAEEALKAMRASQQNAVSAKASSEADFSQASVVAGEAEGLFTKGEFTMAARKFLEARDGFERARRAVQRPHTPPPPTIMPVPTLAPTTTVATTLPPPATLATPPPVPIDESVIRRLIGDYKRAIETKDVSLLKSIKPNVSGSEERAIKGSQSASVDISILSVDIQGTKATVMASRRDTGADGKLYNFQQTFILTKSGAGWAIKQIAIQQIGQ